MRDTKFVPKAADGWRPLSALPCKETMKNHNGSPRLNHHQPTNHSRDRNGKRGDWLWAVWLRFSLRDYGFCMGTLLLFSLASVFYQINGGPPRLLLDMRQYLGKKQTLLSHVFIGRLYYVSAVCLSRLTALFTSSDKCLVFFKEYLLHATKVYLQGFSMLPRFSLCCYSLNTGN